MEKFYVWSLDSSNQIDQECIQVATYFVLYCCLADKILDAERIPLDCKYKVYRDLENFVKRSSEKVYDLEELFELRMRVQNFLKKAFEYKDNRKLVIEEKINRAIRSEQFMATHSINDFGEVVVPNLIMDKSTEFVSAAFLLSVYDSIDEHLVSVSETIGRIFGYIDDICDYISDIETGSLNSLLFIGMESEGDFKIEITPDKVEYAIDKLEKEIDRLKEMVGEKMYKFILNELWDWTADVRKYVEI